VGRGGGQCLRRGRQAGGTDRPGRVAGYNEGDQGEWKHSSIPGKEKGVRIKINTVHERADG
jgi:hypothetical protein